MAEVKTDVRVDVPWTLGVDQEAMADSVDSLLFLLKVPEDPSFIMYGSTDIEIVKNRKAWIMEIGEEMEKLMRNVWGIELYSEAEIFYFTAQEKKKQDRIEKERKAKLQRNPNWKPKVPKEQHMVGQVIDWNTATPPMFPDVYEQIDGLEDVTEILRYWRSSKFTAQKLVWGEDVNAGNRAIRTTPGKLEEEFGVKIME